MLVACIPASYQPKSQNFNAKTVILTWNKKGVLDTRDTDGYLCERDDDDGDDVMIYVFQEPIHHPGWARWEEHGEVLSLSTPFQTHAKKSQANVQLKSSIPIGAKVEISPKGFTLVSQGPRLN